MYQFVVPRTVTNMESPALISEISPTCGNSNNSRCFSSSSASLQHSSTPKCTLRKLALDCMASFNPSQFSVGSFYQSPPPPSSPKKDASVVKKYSSVPDSTALDVVLNTHKALLLMDF